MGNDSLWDYFVKIDCDNDERKAMCKLCNEIYNYTATSHNLKIHINRKHSDVVTMETKRTNKTRQRRVNTFRHKIWGYFTKIDGTKFAKCNICLKQFSYRSTVGNLSSHLLKHPNAHQTFLQNKPLDKEDFRSAIRLEVVKNSEDTQEPQKIRDVWQYFEQESTKARCVVCRELIADAAYDNLKEHLFERHPKLLLQLEQDQEDGAKSETSSEEDNTYTEVVYLEQDSASEDTPRPSENSKITSTLSKTLPIKRKRNNSSSDQPTFNVIKNIETTIHDKEEKTEDETELDIFIKYIRCLLKKLSPEAFSKVQVDILKTIMDAQYLNKITDINMSGPTVLTDISSCSVSNVIRVSEIPTENGALVGNYTIELAPKSNDISNTSTRD